MFISLFIKRLLDMLIKVCEGRDKMKKQYWYQKQLRMLQTVLREPDIVDYNAQKVVEYLKKSESNCIIINAGGVIDFFNNETKLSRVNTFMTDEDMMGDLVDECHENGIKVIVRVDFRGVNQERYERQPNWFAQDEEGNGKIGWEKIYMPCYNAYYSNGHAVEYITQMMTKYNIDGVWENCVGFGSGPCYCKTCRDKYRKDLGKEIPIGDDYGASIFDEYRHWKAGCADEHIRLLRDTVKSFGEDKAYCAEIFGMFHASNALQTGIDLYNAKEHFDFLVSPAFLDGSSQESKKYDDLTYAASSIRFLKAIESDKPSVLLCGNNGTKWRYVKSPRQETKIWMWEAVAVGASFWNCMFNGQHPDMTFDRRNAYIEKEIFKYLKNNEKILENQMPVEDVGIYYSKYTRDAIGNDDEAKDEYGVFIKGVERALISQHIQYNFIPDLDFSYEKIKNIKTLIIPNGALMKDQDIEIIKEYVENGGGLIASYETSLYDEKGKPRSDFGLKELFGCSFTGMRKDTSTDCYQMVREKHKILNNMDVEKTQMIMNEGQTLLCTQQNKIESIMVCSYVPLIYNQPPEYAWIPQMVTEYPTIMTNTYGKGRIVYFANQTDKLCYTNGHEDFFQTFYNAILWTNQEPLILETDAPESVHIVLMEKKGNTSVKLLSLVNTTAGVTRPIKKVVPVHNIEVSIKMKGEGVVEWEVLKQDSAITINSRKERGGTIVTVKIDKIVEFNAIHLWNH